MPTDPNEQAANALNKAARAYLSAYDKSDSEARNALREVEKALLEARRTRLKDTVSPIGTFFADIGKGVVAAQRDLDTASEEYVRDLIKKKRTADPHAESVDVPGAAMFRIPKVSAELKLSLEKTEGTDWNVVFYSKEEQTKELQQQTLSFEIVSVPIPPGYAKVIDALPAKPSPSGDVKKVDAPAAQKKVEALPPGQRAIAAAARPGEPKAKGPPHAVFYSAAQAEAPPSAPDAASEGELEIMPAATPPPESAPAPTETPAERAFRFVATPALREDLRDDVARLGKGLSPAQRRRVESLLLARWDHVIVASPDTETALLVLATEGKSPELVFWQLVRQPASLVELYRMPATASARRSMERVRRFFVALGRALRR